MKIEDGLSIELCYKKDGKMRVYRKMFTPYEVDNTVCFENRVIASVRQMWEGLLVSEEPK